MLPSNFLTGQDKAVVEVGPNRYQVGDLLPSGFRRVVVVVSAEEGGVFKVRHFVRLIIYNLIIY